MLELPGAMEGVLLDVGDVKEKPEPLDEIKTPSLEFQLSLEKLLGLEVEFKRWDLRERFQLE